MPSRTFRTLSLALGLVALGPLGSTAYAQGNTFNPYGNSGYADYREFGNPAYSTNPALPGQAIAGSRPSVTRPRANSFQQYTEELDAIGSDPGDSRRASSNLPYYQAYQLQNSRYNRTYKPNEYVDRKFNERTKLREAAYAKALEEKDPVKRARLLRQVEEESFDRPTTSASAARSRAASAAALAAKGTDAKGNDKDAKPKPNPVAGSAPRPRPTDPSSKPTTSAPAPGRSRPPSPYGSAANRRAGSPPPPPVTAPSRNRRSSAPNPSGPAPDPSTIPTPAPGA